MTKKEFKELASVHKYGRGRRPENLIAIFFEWKSGDKDGKYFGGFKYCVYARTCNAKTEDLMTALYNLITGKTDDIKEWWINLVYAENDQQRFKVPLSSGGLYSLKVKNL